MDSLARIVTMYHGIVNDAMPEFLQRKVRMPESSVGNELVSLRASVWNELPLALDELTVRTYFASAVGQEPTDIQTYALSVLEDTEAELNDILAEQREVLRLPIPTLARTTQMVDDQQRAQDAASRLGQRGVTIHMTATGPSGRLVVGPHNAWPYLQRQIALNSLVARAHVSMYQTDPHAAEAFSEVTDMAREQLEERVRAGTLQAPFMLLAETCVATSAYNYLDRMS